MARHLSFAALAVLLVAAASPSAFANGSPDKPASLGIGLGSGTGASGLSAKYVLTSTTALQANIGGWAVGYLDYGGLAVSADYLLLRGPMASGGPVDVKWNLGLGVGVGLYENLSALSVAAVAGAEFILRQVPIDIVLEARPIFGVSPEAGFAVFRITFHVRYWL